MIFSPAAIDGVDQKKGMAFVWVRGIANGGVSKPRGVSNCDPWQLVDANLGIAPPYTRVAADGVVESIYLRYCGDVVQFVWVRPASPRELAGDAYDVAVAKIPKPSVVMAPPVDKQIVNLETWFAVTPTQPVSATAAIPGLSATVTARPQSIRLTTGSSAPGDPATVECRLWGSTAAAAGGCSWTPRFPSIPKFTGGGYAYHGSIAVVWTITWTSTSGAGGDLGTYESTTPIDMAVREIQTVGARG